MPDFKQSNPKHQPFKCSPAWHLWRHGLALAIYLRAGTITNGGKTEFFAKVETLKNYFGSSYEAARRARCLLVSNGWLSPVPNDEGYFYFVTHDAWAILFPNKCCERDLLPWSGDADPFIGKLWAAAGGRFRAKPHFLLGVRKYGTEEEILAVFNEELEAAKVKRMSGDKYLTAPSQCFYRVYMKLKEKFTVETPTLK